MPAADRQSFLTAIRANPADDAPRLVYADWLDDRGDADQAEFIRCQLALATLETGDDGHTQLEIRCRELLRLHGEEWLGDLARFVGVEQLEDPVWPIFRRGLPERITVSGATFLDHSERLLRGTVSGVRLTPGGRSTERLFFVDGWDRISAAGFVGHRDLFNDRTPPWWWGEEDGDRPWSAPPQYFKQNARLDGLTEVRFELEFPDGDDWGAALASTRFGPRLQSLAATAGGAPVGLHLLPLLERLELTAGGDEYSFCERAEAPWASRLTHLRLKGFNLEEGGGDCIARMPNLKSFTQVDGRVNHWMGEGGVAFWTHAAFPDNSVRPNDLQPLLTAGPLLMLRSLDLSRNRLAHAGPHAVGRCPAAETLRVVRMNGLGETAHGVADFLVRDLPQLDRLEFGADDGYGGVLPQQVAELASSDRLPNLLALRFAGTRLCVPAFLESAGASRIQDLRIDAPMPREIAIHLAESKRLDGLRLLDVVTDDTAAVAVLRQRWGNRVRVRPTSSELTAAFEM